MHLNAVLKKLLVTTAGALLATGAQAAPALKLGLTTWIGYSPFYVADALDLYKKYDLKVKLQTFTDPAMLPSAMAGSAIDGALMTYDQVVGAAGQGQNFKVVMPVDYSYGGDAGPHPPLHPALPRRPLPDLSRRPAAPGPSNRHRRRQRAPLANPRLAPGHLSLSKRPRSPVHDPGGDEARGAHHLRSRSRS